MRACVQWLNGYMDMPSSMYCITCLALRLQGLWLGSAICITRSLTNKGVTFQNGARGVFCTLRLRPKAGRGSRSKSGPFDPLIFAFDVTSAQTIYVSFLNAVECVYGLVHRHGFLLWRHLGRRLWRWNLVRNCVRCALRMSNFICIHQGCNCLCLARRRSLIANT